MNPFEKIRLKFIIWKTQLDRNKALANKRKKLKKDIFKAIVYIETNRVNEYSVSNYHSSLSTDQFFILVQSIESFIYDVGYTYEQIPDNSYREASIKIFKSSNENTFTCSN